MAHPVHTLYSGDLVLPSSSHSPNMPLPNFSLPFCFCLYLPLGFHFSPFSQSARSLSLGAPFLSMFARTSFDVPSAIRYIISYPELPLSLYLSLPLLVVVFWPLLRNISSRISCETIWEKIWNGPKNLERNVLGITFSKTPLRSTIIYDLNNNNNQVHKRLIYPSTGSVPLYKCIHPPPSPHNRWCWA